VAGGPAYVTGTGGGFHAQAEFECELWA